MISLQALRSILDHIGAHTSKMLLGRAADESSARQFLNPETVAGSRWPRRLGRTLRTRKGDDEMSVVPAVALSRLKSQDNSALGSCVSSVVPLPATGTQIQS